MSKRLKKPQNFKDKRRFPRISRNIDIEVSELTFPFSEAPVQKEASVDIGGNGIRFTSSVPYEVKALLNLKINIIGWEGFKKPFSKLVNISSDACLTAVAEVVWCHEVEEGQSYELGVKFLNIYEDDYEALMRYLENAV